MIAQEFTLGSSPTLLLGPVDADYEVLITGSGSANPVQVGATSAGVSGTAYYALPVCTGSGNPPAKLRLKVGDSLYAYAGGSVVGITIFAQPC